ncbi:10689_t:CDS:2, partial [Scutellospora calospora]
KPEQITDITAELEETNCENSLNDTDDKLFEEYIDLELNTLNGTSEESGIIYQEFELPADKEILLENIQEFINDLTQLLKPVGIL